MMPPARPIRSLIVLAVLACAGPARADVEAGVRAFQAGDYQTALDEWRVDAAQGDANALFNLGQAYRLGKGVEVDLDQAENYYLRASRAGHPAAMGNLATRYYFSKQPPRVADAVAWWEMGAAAGDPRSQFILGAMMFNGDPVEKDIPRAYAWTWLAAQTGLEEAQAALSTMTPHVAASVRETAEAGALDLMTEDGRDYWRAQLPPGATVPEPTSPPAGAVAAAQPPAPRPAADAGGAVYRVNLASMGSPGEAETFRGSMMERHGGLLADLPLRIAAADRDGRTWYRLQAGSFPTAAQAQAACDNMKAGGLDCFVLRTED